MAQYVQRKDKNGLETVDEFPAYEEAHKMLVEYRTSDPYAYYYLSSRPCKGWRQQETPS